MVWYGFSFYLIFFSAIFFFLFFLIKLFFSQSFSRTRILIFFFQLTFSFFLFMVLLIFYFIYTLFDYFSSFSFVYIDTVLLFDNFTNQTYFNIYNFSFNLAYIYYFPFIYIFILITFLSIVFCLAYNFNELVIFSFYCLIILSAGYLLFFTDSLIIFFLAYECLLIPSFFILYRFAKTRRCIEAAYLMFFWTQFGALFLIFSFLYIFFLTNSTSFFIIGGYSFSPFDINFLFLCWICGFGVKLPIWPFYGWLPKAHVEASTNFSIFLSGVLVKFAFFGFLKCLLTLQLEPQFIYVYPFLLIGIVDATFKLFYQVDLKKLVAYSTVVEMHWLVICIISGYSPLMLSGFCMLISHAILSANSFLLVDAINRRFKSRLINEISGVNYLCPKLFLLSLLNCLVFLGFPGSIFFIAEFLFFSFFFDLYPLFCFFLMILLYLIGPTFFLRSWINLLFGMSQFFKKTIPMDLNKKEFLLYFGNILLLFWLGATWQIFLF